MSLMRWAVLIASSTRNEVRRAAKDEHSFEFSAQPDDVLVNAFFDFYAEFARMKGLAPLNRARLLGMRESQALVLTRISAPDGTTLVWHCYVHVNGNARQVHSASLFRASADKTQQRTISRANRLLHWLDMLRFRELGFTTFDFGGWYNGQEDVEKLKINQFKEGFGGRVQAQYSIDYGRTLKGTLAVQFRRAAGALRGDK